MKFYHALLLLAVVTTSNVSASNYRQDIGTRVLTKNDKEWVLENFVLSFMSVYKDKVFVATVNGDQQILGPEEFKEKESLLLDAANKEFNDYVVRSNNSYKAIGIMYNNELVGSLFYRLMGDDIIYLAQYFIIPKYQKQGIGLHVIGAILPKLHPEYKRYEVLTRHQNDAAMLLYKKLGFSVGDILLVHKYEYDPLRYIGFYKQL
jgi:ribosomal protein S18 acetylase RimI-like enzyme